jgi:hypothetical protein
MFINRAFKSGRSDVENASSAWTSRSSHMHIIASKPGPAGTQVSKLNSSRIRFGLLPEFARSWLSLSCKLSKNGQGSSIEKDTRKNAWYSSSNAGPRRAKDVIWVDGTAYARLRSLSGKKVTFCFNQKLFQLRIYHTPPNHCTFNAFGLRLKPGMIPYAWR